MRQRGATEPAPPRVTLAGSLGAHVCFWVRCPVCVGLGTLDHLNRNPVPANLALGLAATLAGPILTPPSSPAKCSQQTQGSDPANKHPEATEDSRPPPGEKRKESPQRRPCPCLE